MLLIGVNKLYFYGVIVNPGGGGTPLYKLYRYVPPQRVGFLRRFGIKRVYTLPISVWNRVWFSRELKECMNVFYSFPSKGVRKKE